MTNPDRALFFVWACQQCIVVPRRLSVSHQFSQASSTLKERGYPVFVRETGGDAVVQGIGIVNLSLVLPVPSTEPDCIGRSYKRLCAPLFQILARHGVKAYCAPVKGAMCDGAYNIVVGGRKLAGTAQRLCTTSDVNGKSIYVALAHMVISVDVDHEIACEAIGFLHSVLGSSSVFDPKSHVNWREVAPSEHFSISEVSHLLCHEYGSMASFLRYEKVNVESPRGHRGYTSAPAVI